MAKIVIETGDVTPIIDELKMLESQRRIALRQQIRMLLSTLSMVRVGMGWKWDDEEEGRKKMNDRAKAVLMAAWNGKEPPTGDDAEHAANMWGLMLAFQTPYEAFDGIVSQLGKRARNLAKRLPVSVWIAQQPGFSMDTLARLVGVLGNPDDYRHWKLCCKKLGLSPYRGKLASSWRSSKDDKLTAEEWVAFGYSPMNRSMIHMVGDAQIRNRSPYRKVYDQHKAKEVAREDENKPKSPMHAHRRAMVVMERRMVRDFWCAWRYGTHVAPEAVAELVA